MQIFYKYVLNLYAAHIPTIPPIPFKIKPEKENKLSPHKRENIPKTPDPRAIPLDINVFYS